MTLEQILTIEAIVQEGSFKAAADFLHKSQPSISMAIKKLEEEYQIILFSRDEYRPTLTNEGRIFFEKAKSVLKQFRELDTTARQMSRGEEVELRISVDAVSPVSLILKFLKQFFSNHPLTRLQLSFEVLNGTLERLVDGEVDFAITPMHGRGDWSVDALPLTKTVIIPVMHAELIKGRKVTDLILREYNQIILADSSRHTKKMSTGILEGGKSITLSEVSFKKEMILQGLGWGGLPYEMVKSELAKNILVPIKTPLIKEREMEIFLVRDPKKSLGPVARELWDKMSCDLVKSEKIGEKGIARKGKK
ncbi:MAG: LysR family transcriptional regulator [Bacteriovorax sp.]|nr:LysR family transcriptional regulator [Bacteriovorax sp.]